MELFTRTFSSIKTFLYEFIFHRIFSNIKIFFYKFTFVQWLTGTRIFHIFVENKAISTGIVSAVLENSIINVSAGAMIQNVKELIFCIFVCSIISFCVDMIIFYFLLTGIKRSKKIKDLPLKYPRLFKIFRNFGFFSMLFYRFIFFGRIPALFSACFANKAIIVLLNFLGALITQSVFLSIGFFFKKSVQSYC